jgi:hypothetical protein
MSKKFKTTPSDLVGLTDQWDSYRFDRAVFHFGLALENELSEAKGKSEKQTEAKRARILARWIPEASSSGGKFRDPAKG